VTAPVGSLDREPPRPQIDVAPLERHDLAEAKTRVTAQQHHQIRVATPLLRDHQQALVLLEVVKPHRLLGIG
jgi:hypothetical protein